jgi:acyl-CoA-dependent ceramide synthase
MQNQIFIPLLLLQILNLFWYYFILRIALRSVLPYCHATCPDVGLVDP